jgi:hypothetical protein
MRRIAYFFFLAALVSGCGPSHPLNSIRVQFHDMQWHDYYLLSTRDTAIVVTLRDGRTDSIEVIPMDKINRISFQGRTTAAQWIGGAGGVFIASSIVTVRNPSASIIYLASIPIGVFIGHAIADTWIELDPYSLEAHDLLHDRSTSDAR